MRFISFCAMLSPRIKHFPVLAGLCCALVAGCDPGPSSPLDEQKDPHFLRGRNYASALDYEAAIKSFEEAIRANPNNASAHKELGLLYYEKRKNYARAIYHLDRLLELRPNDDLAATLREYIVNCKRSLASEVAQLPASQAMQRTLEELQKAKDENAQLRQQNEQLRAQLFQLQQNSEAARRVTPNPTMIRSGTNTATTGMPPAVTPLPPQQPDLIVTNQAPVVEMRTHTVKAGETPASIAKLYRVSADKLMAANPGLNPRRMQIGQELKIPPR